MNTQSKHKRHIPVCPECNTQATLVKGSDVYPHRKDLSYLDFWVCKTTLCDTRVGCHPGTSIPLGSMATLRLRAARSAAHRAFDPTWKKGGFTRTQAYSWLASRLDLDVQDCHIGQFNEKQCNEVILLCRSQLD